MTKANQMGKITYSTPLQGLFVAVGPNNTKGNKQMENGEPENNP
jgi:hypothetical protein